MYSETKQRTVCPQVWLLKRNKIKQIKEYKYTPLSPTPHRPPPHPSQGKSMWFVWLPTWLFEYKYLPKGLMNANKSWTYRSLSNLRQCKCYSMSCLWTKALNRLFSSPQTLFKKVKWRWNCSLCPGSFFKKLSPVVCSFLFEHIIWTRLIIQADLSGPSTVRFGVKIYWTIPSGPCIQCAGWAGWGVWRGKRGRQCCSTPRFHLHKHRWDRLLEVPPAELCSVSRQSSICRTPMRKSCGLTRTS